jgi:hypothetical protein
MGTRGACFTSSRPRVAFSRRCPFEGCYRLELGARATRGFCVAWVPAVPALHQAGPERPSHVDVPSRAVFVSSQGRVPLKGFAWPGCPRCLLYIKQAPSDLLTSMSLRGLFLSRARGSCHSRVLRGMGARGACFTSSRPRATFSRRCPFEGCFRLEPGARAARGFCVAWVPAVPALHQAGPERPSHVDVPSRVVFVSSQGLVPLEGFAWHGCPRCLLYIKQASSDLLTSMSLRGLFSSRARGSPRSRVLLVWQGTGSLNASQSWLRFLQRGRAFLGAANARAHSGRRGTRTRPLASVLAGLRRDDGPSAVMWPLRSWWGPSVGVKGRFPAVNARRTSAPESSPAAYKSEGRGRRWFFTLTLHHFSPLPLRLRLAFATVRCRH